MTVTRYRETEVYRAVQDGELEIDSDGCIWRVARRRWNRWTKATERLVCKRVRAESEVEGYFQVAASWNGRTIRCMAHRLIWLHLHGPIPIGLTINHKNGRGTDNEPNNLELATQSEQILHAMYVLGTQPRLLSQRGEQNRSSKLTDADVKEIRRRRKAGVTQANVARAFGVSATLIQKINDRIYWSHVPD